MPDRLAASPREQILEAAARLFTSKGYAATSTREIADAVGVRQPSLYHYFNGKPGILTELLERSVRPDLDTIERIEAVCPVAAPEVALYLLALTDVYALAAAPHNACVLHRMPDVRNDDAYHQFRDMLPDLGQAYGRLGLAVLDDALATTLGVDQVRIMLTSAVEVVLSARRDGDSITWARSQGIAASCLRVCGVSDERIEYVVATAMKLVAMGS